MINIKEPTMNKESIREKKIWKHLLKSIYLYMKVY